MVSSVKVDLVDQSVHQTPTVTQMKFVTKDCANLSVEMMVIVEVVKSVMV
jgi:hypothetical protein